MMFVDDIKKKIAKIFQAPVPVVEAPTKKTTKTRKKASPPPEPDAEPLVNIIKFDFDPADPKIGSIELDWNPKFIELLIKHGYRGKAEEDIIDLWLNDVCRNIISNPYQGSNVTQSEIVGDTVKKTYR